MSLTGLSIGRADGGIPRSRCQQSYGQNNEQERSGRWPLTSNNSICKVAWRQVLWSLVRDSMAHASAYYFADLTPTLILDKVLVFFNQDQSTGLSSLLTWRSTYSTCLWRSTWLSASDDRNVSQWRSTCTRCGSTIIIFNLTKPVFNLRMVLNGSLTVQSEVLNASSPGQGPLGVAAPEFACKGDWASDSQWTEGAIICKRPARNVPPRRKGRYGKAKQSCDSSKLDRMLYNNGDDRIDQSKSNAPSISNAGNIPFRNQAFSYGQSLLPRSLERWTMCSQAWPL